MHEDRALIRKQGYGQGLHVSDYLTAIRRPGGDEAAEILKCGGDIWWTGELMLKQLAECNMCTCSGNGTQEQAVQDLLCLVDLYLVYLI